MGIFTMPSLGADMEAGKLVEWMVKPGDTVKRGDVVAVVETQKGAIEIEIFEEGKVSELTAELGTELPVGAPLAVVLKPGEAPPAPEAAPAPEPTAAPKPAPVPEPEPAMVATVPAPAPPAAPAPVAAPGAGPMASPAARVRAHELGIDLATLKGSGPGGVIVLGDVEATGTPTPKPEAAPKPKPTGSPMEEMRKAIAAAMTRAKRTIPHFYLSETIDVDPAIRFLEERNADRPPTERVLLGAVFVRAATIAASKVPVMNGHFTEEAGYQPSDTVNPGVAVALRGGGLVAPALMDAVDMSLDDTMAGMRDLVSRARAGRLRSSEMTMGTITVSSLGDTGAEAMTGVIFPPQVALIGLGAPHLRPWVVDGEVVPRHVVTLTVSADHRVSDGRQVARFIAAFEAAVQSPEEL
jgi:pyruvate dehydrogenase E2 component (dihydrolipoamide acetyltransferase)